MGASLTEHGRVGDEGLRVVKHCREGEKPKGLIYLWRKHGLSSCQQPR